MPCSFPAGDTHGLGDCVHFALLLQLYREAGYQVKLYGQANKQWLWRAGDPTGTRAVHVWRPLAPLS